MTPLSKISTSMTAFSVSTSATTSPRLTASPGFTRHSDDGAVLHVGTERRHAKFTHGLTIPLYIEYATAGYGRIQCT